MGWKSTLELTRKEAIELILNNIDTMSNDELSFMLSAGFGENLNLPHYGRNFRVHNNDAKFDEYGNLLEELKDGTKSW